VTLLLQRTAAEDEWVDGIDVCEHHCLDFAEVRRRGVGVVVVRAGRGTRQDARWVEHVRAADQEGLAIGSYWYLYPSHTGPHHQAELWMAAIRSAPWRFVAGHWADVSTTDGFGPLELGRYVAGFLRRMDELLGETVGVFTSDVFWRRNVRFGIGERPRWHCPHPPAAIDAWRPEQHRDAFAFRTRAADRGGPGWHRVRTDFLSPAPTDSHHGLHLVPRGPNESVHSWQSRWLHTSDVAELQQRLVALGADLVVDGVYGPATDAAVRVWGLLRRRDLLPAPAVTLRHPPLPSPDRTAKP
jgi:hypothetical protein